MEHLEIYQYFPKKKKKNHKPTADARISLFDSQIPEIFCEIECYKSDDFTEK